MELSDKIEQMGQTIEALFAEVKELRQDIQVYKQRYLTVAQAQPILGYGRSKIYDLMASGELPYTEFSGIRRIDIRDIERLAEANKVNNRH